MEGGREGADKRSVGRARVKQEGRGSEGRRQE